MKQNDCNDFLKGAVIMDGALIVDFGKALYDIQKLQTVTKKNYTMRKSYFFEFFSRINSILLFHIS